MTDWTDRVEDALEDPASLAVAFGIGALIGVSLALVSIPRRRRSRIPAGLERRYKQVRNAGRDALGDIRRASREIAAELREELAAHLEAGREELTEMARDQIEETRKALRREYKKLRR